MIVLLIAHSSPKNEGEALLYRALQNLLPLITQVIGGFNLRNPSLLLPLIKGRKGGVNMCNHLKKGGQNEAEDWNSTIYYS